MSTKNVGNPLQGRRLKGGGSVVGQKPIEIKASLGDGTTAVSATPFIRFRGGVGSQTDGRFNITTSDPTGGGATPAGTDKAIMISVIDAAGNEVEYWVPIYPVV
tara:strand:- start:513 stop:824 length:312 start_codon:yes stop_codon:yes gene_type:complete